MTKLTLALLLGAGLPGAHGALIVDAFNGPLNVSIPSLGGNPAFASGGNLNAGIIGGARGITFTRTAGNGAEQLNVDLGGSGLLEFASGAFDAVTALVQWDGDTNANSLNATGLGGIDVTQGGANFQFAVYQHSDRPTNLGTDAGLVTITVYTDAGNASRLTLPTINTSFVGPFVPLLYDFSAFVPFLGAGADFTNVGAIELFATGSPQAPGLDLAIDFVEATSIPEPGTLLLLGSALIGIGLLRRR